MVIKVIAIIQARMQSTRLPGKVMKEIMGEPVLWHVYSRAKKAVDRVIVATTVSEEDDQICRFCRERGIPCFRGAYNRHGTNNDVLDRYYQCALVAGTDAVVRITADCPLLDPYVVQSVIRKFGEGYDYVSNVHPATYADGLDCEVFTFEALKTAWHEASLVSERAHVTPYITGHPKKFAIGNVSNQMDLSYMRWTLDTEKDLEFIRRVYEGVGSVDFGMDEVLSLLCEHPQLELINAGVTRTK